MVDSVLSFFTGLPPVLVYAVLGAGSALENLFPPVPADTFILLGGFLAGRGKVDAWTVFAVTWGCNVASALAVYGIGHRYGPTFFEVGLGRHVLTRHQLERLGHFYGRWGTFAIFFTRFLPGLRAVVPAFAGVTHRRFLPVALPLGAASAIWYGALVWVGATTARNLETIVAWLADANRWLLGAALVLVVAIGVWWWRSRRVGHGPEHGVERGSGSSPEHGAERGQEGP